MGLDAFDLVGKPLIELYDMDSLLNGHEPVKGNFLMELSYWNTLIFEACESGKMEERFQLFCRMRKESIQPNSLGSLEDARMLFEKMSDEELVVSNIMISTYAGNGCPKESLELCGCIEMARKLFDEEKSIHRDIIAWNSMINAYSKHGEWFICFQLYTYSQMKISNINLDQVTFLGLLTACVNSGLVSKGKEIFKEMVEIYGYQPSQEHHVCMVYLLECAGQIDEANEIIKIVPLESDARVYGPLLSACKIHSDTRLAELAAQRLINMEPKNSGNYVLLSNIMLQQESGTKLLN
ncbi:hypothetical protein JHK82_024424 [Glycine max]|nr:hypothetical protein JHK82_024424 [Glycine max]